MFQTFLTWLGKEAAEQFITELIKAVKAFLKGIGRKKEVENATKDKDKPRAARRINDVFRRR